MADIELVVKIPKEDYERLKVYEKAPFHSLTSRVYEAIANGTPLPKGHGRIGDLDKLIKAMKERDEDNSGESLNAVDRGYHLACQHMVKVTRECVIIKADKAEGEE